MAATTQPVRKISEASIKAYSGEYSRMMALTCAVCSCNSAPKGVLAALAISPCNSGSYTASSRGPSVSGSTTARVRAACMSLLQTLQVHQTTGPSFLPLGTSTKRTAACMVPAQPVVIIQGLLAVGMGRALALTVGARFGAKAGPKVAVKSITRLLPIVASVGAVMP